MAYIRTIEQKDASPELAELYRRVGNPDGTLDNVMAIHSLNPASLRTHFDMYVEAMHKPSPLTRAEREMAAVVVSRLNGCIYCLTHHHAGLVRLLSEDRHAAADSLRDGVPTGLTEREQALCRYAEAMTTQPNRMMRADVENLRAVGLDDRAILDLAQCIGYFNYVNRIVTGLGVELERRQSGVIGQWPSV